jgi:hypothetical protein
LPRVYDILSRYSTPLGSHIPEIKGLAYADDGNIIAKLSTAFKLISMLAPVFKKDANHQRFSLRVPRQTICLNAQKHFLDTDPDLADIAHHFTRDMFTTEGIEVLGTPVGNDRFIQTFIAQNCLKIMGDIGKHACLTDGFVHAQLLKLCQNTRTQFISANINIPDSDNVITAQHKHVDRKIAYEILQKGTRGSFRNWSNKISI